MMNKRISTVYIGAIISAVMGVCYLALGLLMRSWWLLTLGGYYCVLGSLEIALIVGKDGKHGVARPTGWMLMFLSVPLSGVVILSVVTERGHRFNIVPMLAIAVLAFTKITFATVNLIRSRSTRSQRAISLRSILLVDGLVSIFALQRSMLVSFDGMTPSEIVAMNLSTGLAVLTITFLIGLFLAKRGVRS